MVLAAKYLVLGVSNMKNIMVTGAGGFVGRNLEEYLSKKEQYKVFAVKRTNLNLLDECAVKNYIKDNEINIIIHCANVGGSRKTNYDVGNVDFVEQNLRMFFNLQRCLTPDMHMIHFGSGAEYDRGNYKPKMSEEYFDKHVPTDAYGYSKYVMSKCIENSANITCLRIFGLFGKYEDYRFKFISNAVVKNILKMPIVINQNVIFDYLYIDDFCKMVEPFIENISQHRHYNITPTESIDLVSIAKIINNISDYTSEIVIVNAGMNTEYSGDNCKIKSELGDFTFTEYEQSIRQLYEHYKSVIDDLDLETVKNDPYIKQCKVK